MSHKKLYDDDSEEHGCLRRHSTDLNSLIIIKMKPIRRLRRDELEDFKVVRILFTFARKYNYSIGFGTLGAHFTSEKEGISIIISNINQNEFRRALRMVKAIMNSFWRVSVRKFIIIGWKNRYNDDKTKIIFKG